MYKQNGATIIILCASCRVCTQDPMSHRIIEKRRRDRMNNCLADLSRLIPAEYMKKGRGRVEKTEIIEMAIKHMKYLQSSGRLKLRSSQLLAVAYRNEFPNAFFSSFLLWRYRFFFLNAQC